MPWLPAAMIGALWAAAGPAQAQTVEDELLRLEAARSEAIRSGDLAVLDAIYADDFAGVAGTGQLVSKPQLFEFFGRVDPKVRFTTEELTARAFGETGVVVGRLAGRREDGSLISEARFTHVYVRRDGRWRFVAGQSTPILATAEPQPARLPPAERVPRARPFDEPLVTTAPGVTPPRKIHDVEPRWAGAAQRREANATLELIIGRDGRVAIEETRHTTDPLWEQACRAAVAQWRYEPARRGGQPVAVRTTVSCTLSGR